MKLTDQTKYDYLLHICKEKTFSKKEVIEKIKELFPDFDDKGKHIYDVYASNYNLELYVYNRILGLSRQEAAHKIELTGHLFEEMLQGIGLSLDCFIKVVEAELYVRAELKAKHLKILDKASENGNTKAALTLLERLLPDEFSAKSSIDDIAELLSSKTKNIDKELTAEQIGQELKSRGLDLPDLGADVTEGTEFVK